MDETSMEIINIPFEKPLTLVINGQHVDVTLFKTVEHGNIKFGINAPRNLGVDREEIHQAKKARQQLV